MPKRIQRSRAKGWRMPEGAVYVGRPTKWGNPWFLNARGGHYFVDGPRANPLQHPCGNKEGARLVAVLLFRKEREGVRSMDLTSLRSKDLVCWCALDQPCHADVLLEIANRPVCEEVT